MKTFELKGSLRNTLGKKEANRLRKEGFVPGVLYGAEAPIHFYVNQKEVSKMICSPDVYLAKVDLDGTLYTAYMQDIQFHPVSDEPIHIDFLRVYDDKPIKVELPLKVNGFAKGIKKGGKLQIEIRKLQIFGLAKDLPDVININVDDLDIGQSLRVSDIDIDGVTILNNKSIPVVRIAITRAARAAGATEEAK